MRKRRLWRCGDDEVAINVTFKTLENIFKIRRQSQKKRIFLTRTAFQHVHQFVKVEVCHNMVKQFLKLSTN